MEISDFTFNSYLYLLIDYNLSIIPVLTLLPWFTNQIEKCHFVNYSYYNYTRVGFVCFDSDISIHELI